MASPDGYLDTDMIDDEDEDDEGASSDEADNSSGRNARIDREMADLIRERDKFLATRDTLAKKRVSRVTKKFQYHEHDDSLYHDPSDSRPNERRRRRRVEHQTFPPQYDEAGILLSSGRDLCDCLDARCSGCHDECKACGSHKCSIVCRSGRTWSHREVIQFHPNKPKEISRSRPV